MRFNEFAQPEQLDVIQLSSTDEAQIVSQATSGNWQEYDSIEALMRATEQFLKTGETDE